MASESSSDAKRFVDSGSGSFLHKFMQRSSRSHSRKRTECRSTFSRAVLTSGCGISGSFRLAGNLDGFSQTLYDQFAGRLDAPPRHGAAGGDAERAGDGAEIDDDFELGPQPAGADVLDPAAIAFGQRD